MRPVIDRRAFIGTLAGSLLAAPLGVDGQGAAKVARIGYLVLGSLESPETRTSLDAFRQGLRERGYVEGQSIVIEYRAADGKTERLPALAADLAGLKVDLIVAPATPGALAARRATSTIRIVSPNMADPVHDGLVASLARPGANVTGSTFLGPDLVPKRLALLKEALPAVSRIAVLWHPCAFGERTMKDMTKETEVAGRALGVQLQFVEARDPDALDRVFSAMGRERADALIVLPSAMLYNERRRLVALAARSRLPAMYQSRQFVELGGLIAYGASITDGYRRAATYVDKILKGARPGDLPVEQPTKFELIINLKTAKTLGLTIPLSLLQQADQVIE